MTLEDVSRKRQRIIGWDREEELRMVQAGKEWLRIG